MQETDTNFEMKTIYQLMIVVMVSLISWSIGYDQGVDRGEINVRYRDHVQAQAGVFIDGHDRNRVYDVKLREGQ